MTPLAKGDLLSYEAYGPRRHSFRQRIIELKQHRRLSVGDTVSLLFENRETIRFQIQEMIHAERIIDPDKVQDELDVYNALLPGDGELSATFFIEIGDRRQIERDLNAFKGIDRGRTVALLAGPLAVYGRFDRGHRMDDKVSAVHNVKFRPSPEWIRKVAEADAAVSIRIDHSTYQRDAPVSDEMRREWLTDLRAQTGLFEPPN